MLPQMEEAVCALSCSSRIYLHLRYLLTQPIHRQDGSPGNPWDLFFLFLSFSRSHQEARTPDGPCNQSFNSYCYAEAYYARAVLLRIIRDERRPEYTPVLSLQKWPREKHVCNGTAVNAESVRCLFLLSRQRRLLYIPGTPVFRVARYAARESSSLGVATKSHNPTSRAKMFVLECTQRGVRVRAIGGRDLNVEKIQGRIDPKILRKLPSVH